MTPQNPAQAVSDAALIEFSRIKLWFFRDLVDAQRKALFLLCGFSDAVTHGELDTHSAQLRALRHALRIDAARELQQAQVVGKLSAEDMFERYVADGIARSPEPLRELGRYLAGVLDEDEFPKANELILQLATTTTQSSAPVVGEPEWIVNDIGELGVKLGDRLFFLYKGDNIEYSGLHEDGSPMLYRTVGKREFGEVCHPIAWIQAGRSEDRYTVNLTYHPQLSFGKPEDGDWRPMPVRESALTGRG